MKSLCILFFGIFTLCSAYPIRFFEDVVYCTRNDDVGSVQLKFDLYSPDDTTKSHPLVFFIHGGGGDWGDKNGFRDICKEYVNEHGWAAATVSYRKFSEGGQYLNNIADLQRCVQFIRSNAKKYNIDSNRIIVLGHSFGAFLASWLGVSDLYVEFNDTFPKLTAVVAAAGFFDLTKSRDKNADYKKFLEMHKGLFQWYVGAEMPTIEEESFSRNFLGNTEASALVEESTELQSIIKSFNDKMKPFQDASSIYYVSPTCPPFLLIHATDDCAVLSGQSVSMHERLTEMGVESELHLMSSGGHGAPFGIEGKKRMFKFISKFFGYDERHKKAIAKNGSIIDSEWILSSLDDHSTCPNSATINCKEYKIDGYIELEKYIRGLKMVLLHLAKPLTDSEIIPIQRARIVPIQDWGTSQFSFAKFTNVELNLQQIDFSVSKEIKDEYLLVGNHNSCRFLFGAEDHTNKVVRLEGMPFFKRNNDDALEVVAIKSKAADGIDGPILLTTLGINELIDSLILSHAIGMIKLNDIY